MIRKNNNKGFTLVELLIVILLLTVIAVISSDMVINLTSTSTKIQNKLNLEEDYTFLNSKLTKIIQDADDISYSLGKLTIVSGTTTYELKVDVLPNTTNRKLWIRTSLPVSNPPSNFIQLSNSDILESTDVFYVSITDNPRTVTFNFTLIKDKGNPRLQTSTPFNKIITANKTYKQ